MFKKSFLAAILFASLFQAVQAGCGCEMNKIKDKEVKDSVML